MSLNTNVGFGGVLLVTLGTLLWWWTRSSKRRQSLPTKWKQVGELGKLVAYPVKSVGGIFLDEAQCTPMGLKNGLLRDRVFMVVNAKKVCVNGSVYPKMTRVRPSFLGDVLTLEAEEMPTLKIVVPRSLEEVEDKSRISRTMIWEQEITTVDCGNEAADWFTKHLVGPDSKSLLRLVYHVQEKTDKSIREKNKFFTKLTREDLGALSESTSYMLMSEESVKDLNSRLPREITPFNFRPNFLVRSSSSGDNIRPLKPFEEDKWEFVKIGDAVFRSVKPCFRCALVNVDPRTGERVNSVLNTLKGYRRPEDPKLNKAGGNSPIMGVHLGLEGSDGCTVRVGDPVFVGV